MILDMDLGSCVWDNWLGWDLKASVPLFSVARTVSSHCDMEVNFSIRTSS